ncbi:uncharacterized protein LOC120845797 [Ixodes scapularis]|uniref:uncharacterized protein LOC120845797 n=1 Tax=Ixodes scapularis TaxID=6945 RepID=UPI001A9E3867|nr:uncharacterized protein LOC120845797 [Ixodes scapularis]
MLQAEETLAARMHDNLQQIEVGHSQNQERIKEQQWEVALLMKERDDLSVLLATFNNANKEFQQTRILEQRRKRIKELDERVAKLRKKVQEQATVIGPKEEERDVRKLKEEILEMKKTRVRLMRQLKKESEQHRRAQREHDRECANDRSSCGLNRQARNANTTPLVKVQSKLLEAEAKLRELQERKERAIKGLELQLLVTKKENRDRMLCLLKHFTSTSWPDEQQGLRVGDATLPQVIVAKDAAGTAHVASMQSPGPSPSVATSSMGVKVSSTACSVTTNNTPKGNEDMDETTDSIKWGLEEADPTTGMTPNPNPWVGVGKRVRHKAEHNVPPDDRRPHDSNQDLFLLLQHTFLSPSSCQVHALVTVDVRKAFDNISHDHILASVRETECGQNLYTYIQNILKDRTACFRIGGELSQPFSLTRGTPQGAVLSPTLFNLGMAQLARCLQQIPHLSHIFYSDDLTLWCTHGSPGEVESTLQKGLDTITVFLTQAGLKPAPEKSELLLLSQTQYQRSVNHLISLYLDHQTIPRVSLCKVLGIHLHDRSNQANITPAINTCHSITHLVRRVVQRRAGLNEKQASQLVHALALSKILYSVPYFTLTRQQLNKLSSALSTLYKASLNLPIHTSTQRLYETGLFLPLSSLLHLHRDRQLARLSGSHQGRWILEQAGLSPIDFYLHLPALPLPSNLRFALLPRRMTPGLDDGRRDAQALHHNPPFQTQTVAYTDASILDTGTAAYAIYIPKHSLPILHTCGPYSDPPSITTLELVPIIHAIISFSQLPRTSAYTVYSDSMAAIRSLQQRQIPADLREDLEMALHSLSSSSVTIRWVPGHAGIAGNALVHQLAREFHSRAPAIPWLSPPTNDEAAEYKKTLKLHYKQIRISHELLPRPHPQLSVAQTHILRKIQTNTLVTPARLYLFRYRSDPSCPNCPAPYANQEHCLLHCPVAYTTSFLLNPPPPSWSAWLASPQLEDQLALVLQAEDILGT